MIKSFKFLALGLVFAFVVSCSAEDTTPPTAEESFAANFGNVVVTTTTGGAGTVCFVSSISGKYIIAKTGRHNFESLYEGDTGNTVARFKHSDGSYIKYIYNGDDSSSLVKVITATSGEASGEAGTEVADAAVATIVTSEIYGAFAKGATGKITTVAGQIDETPKTPFATLDDNGNITMEASADTNVKKILDYLWGAGNGGGKTISPIFPGDVIFLVVSKTITVVARYGTSDTGADDIPSGTVFTWGNYFKPKTDGLIITPPNNVGLEKVVVATIE